MTINTRCQRELWNKSYRTCNNDLAKNWLHNEPFNHQEGVKRGLRWGEGVHPSSSCPNTILVNIHLMTLSSLYQVRILMKTRKGFGQMKGSIWCCIPEGKGPRLAAGEARVGKSGRTQPTSAQLQMVSLQGNHPPLTPTETGVNCFCPGCSPYYFLLTQTVFLNSSPNPISPRKFSLVQWNEKKKKKAQLICYNHCST